MKKVCWHADCRKPLEKPLQCAQCKAAKYCSKDCQKKAWKAGHKRECVSAGGKKAKSSAAAWARSQSALHQLLGVRSGARGGPTAAQERALDELQQLLGTESCDLVAEKALELASMGVWEVEPQVFGAIVHNVGDCNQSLESKKIELYEQSLAIAEELGDRAGQAAMLNDLGICYSSLGQNAKAMELFEQALAIKKELGDREGQGKTLTNLSICYNSLGQYEKAVELYESALAIFKEQGHRAGQGNTLGGLGGCYMDLCQFEKAVELLEQALAIEKEQALAIEKEPGDRAGQRKKINGLGNCYQSLGQYDKTMELYEQALAIDKDLGDRAGQAATLFGLGTCYTSLGQYENAVELLESALAIDKDLGDRAGQGSTLNGLGNCYGHLGRQWQADRLDLHEQALVIFKELDSRAGQAVSLNGLGHSYATLCQYEKAIELFEQALAIKKELGDREGQAVSLNGLGTCYMSLGQHAEAIARYEQALAIVVEVGSREGQGAIYNGIGTARALSGDGTAAACALARGLVVLQRVEQDVGSHDDRRVSVFEDQLQTYRCLQGVLLGQGGQAAGWALGVAAESKGRALAYHLGLGAGGGGGGDDGGDQSVDRTYEDMCEAWWSEVQRLARAEGAATRVLEYSFVASFESGAEEERLAIWVVSGATGELLCSKVVSSTGLGGSTGRSIKGVLAEARSSMNVRGRDAMGDARNARGIAEIRGRLFSSLLKQEQEYARGQEGAQARTRGLNIISQTAAAQTTRSLPGLFENMVNDTFLTFVLPQLDFESLMSLLCSCKSFRDLEVIAMHPKHRAARRFIIDTALQQMNFLDDCKVYLEIILDPKIIRAWMRENDGSEVLDFDYFDFYKRHFYRQHAGELGDQVQDDNPQAGTSFSFWDYLGRETPDPDDSDEKLEWFTHEIDSALNKIRDEVLDSFKELLDLPADHLTIQTQQVGTAMIRKRYASLTCSQTDGSRFSVLDQLHHEVAQRRAAAVDLHSRLQDFNETLLFHSILRKLNTGDLECVEEWIGIHRDDEGAPTRNERAKPEGKAEMQEIIRERKALALGMLQRLKARSFERELGGVVGYCNNFSHLARSYSTHQTTAAASERKKAKETWEVIRKKQHTEEIASETSLLKELYAALIAPVERSLEGAEELLIVPHKELFEVPWAALTDADGGYLIERHVIRTAPSLRVARQAADKMQQHVKQAPAHVVLVGNPLPTRLPSLRFAEEEVEDIEDILNRAGLEVLPKHNFRSNRNPPATKTNLKMSLEGADWAHMALHGDLETDALVLADPYGNSAKDTTLAHQPATLTNRLRLQKITNLEEVVIECSHTLSEIVNKRIEDMLGALKKAAPKPLSKASDLLMNEVQGSEQEKGVKMAPGATVVLSACNTGRGEIKAEGVVGIARGFLLANASAAVVSLWSVDDGSTAALMRNKYKHLVEGCTVPKALRLAMLHLARRPDRLALPHKGELERNKQVARPPTPVDPMFVHTRKYVKEPQFLSTGPLYDANSLFSPHKTCLMPNRPSRGRDPEACESLEACQQGSQAARDSGQYLKLGDFTRQDGDGARGSSGGGSGGVLPALQPWIEMLGGGTEGVSRCAASSSAAAHAATHTHFCETEEERWQYWHEFCKRDVAPKCVLDFGYTDRGRGGLNLLPDDKLLERVYCFEDLEDDMHLLLGGERRRVILKVHTLRKWRQREDKLYERASKVTAVKVMYAYWNANTKMFEMDRQSELKILPVSKTLVEKWRDSYHHNRYDEIEWEWRIPDSMPSLDHDKGDGEVKRLYDEVRAAIKLGERMFHRGAKATDKCMQDHDSPWQEVTGVVQVSFYLPPPPPPSPSHTSHHPLPSHHVSRRKVQLGIKLYFSSRNIGCQILNHTPTTFRQTQCCETAAKSNTKPSLPMMWRTG
jgi:CHAT domain-containing protein/tetratricopeptide (TPR) repeat protein